MTVFHFLLYFFIPNVEIKETVPNEINTIASKFLKMYSKIPDCYPKK